jgi:hypothetical protein
MELIPQVVDTVPSQSLLLEALWTDVESLHPFDSTGLSTSLLPVDTLL